MPETYTVRQVADILGYSTNSIYTFLKEGRIHGVRVGKGRFRIAQEEVDRLLQSTPKEPLTPQAQPSEIATQIKTTEPEISSKVSLVLPRQHVDLRLDKILFPNFFHWFISIASIVFGTSLVLFSRNLENISGDRFFVWLMPIQICLIAGSIGYLLSQIQRKYSQAWTVLFGGILVFAYATFALIMTMGGQWGITYGLIALVLLLSLLVKANSTIWILLLDTLLSLSYAFGFTFFPSYLPVGLEEFATATQSPLLRALPLVATVALIILAIMSLRRHPNVFMAIMAFKSLLYVGLSVLLAHESYWGRSLLLAVFSLFVLFLHKGGSISPLGKQEKIRAYGCFGIIICFFGLAVGMIRVMQLNTYDYSAKELASKVSYGKTVVESTIESIQAALVFQSKDPVFVQALERGDIQSLVDANKTTFEVNRNLRQLLTVDTSGNGIASYPLMATNSAFYTSEDFFGQVRLGGKPYIGYASLTSSEEPRSIIVSVPVRNTKQQFIGTLTGSIDLGILANKLQSFFAAEDNASVVLVDEQAVRIVTASHGFIGRELDPTDPVRLGLIGQNGVVQGYSAIGQRTLTAYDAIPARGWAIGAKQSLNSVFGTTVGGILTILVVIALSIGVCIFLFVDYQNHPHLQETQTKEVEDTS